jgi:hypothetical protein
MNTTLKSITLAAAASLSVVAYAGDKEVLDLLVKKGVVSAEERAKTIEEAKSKASAANLDEVFSKEDATKRLTFSGRVQFQYASIETEQGTLNPVTVNQFMARRLYLGFSADIGDGMSGEIVNNFVDNTLDKALVTFDGSLGKLEVGYRKTYVVVEETTSSAKIPTVERSLATRYFTEGKTTQGGDLGARHTGLYYTGKLDNLTFGVSLFGTKFGDNGAQAATNNNDLGYGAVLGYKNKVSDTEIYGIGVNYVASKYAGTGTPSASELSLLNPYIDVTLGGANLIAEMILADFKDVTNSPSPQGVNVTLVQKLNDSWFAVARYSKLDADGRNSIDISDSIRRANDTSLSTTFTKADSIYLGVIYKINGDNVKVTAGYEMADFKGATSAAGGATQAEANAFRIQTQILF